MTVSELIRAARRDGWKATLLPGGHWRLDHPDASKPVIFGATPSDGARWWRNTLSEVKRALPPEPKPDRPAEPRRRRPRPAHRPEPLRAFPEGPIPMLALPQPERRVYPDEPPRKPMFGAPRLASTRW